MSFLSCIGKKSKKRRLSKNQPLDRLQEDGDEYKKVENKDEDKVSQKSTSASKKSPSGSLSGSVKPVDISAENARLQSEVDRLELENKVYKGECEQHDDVIKGHVDRIHTLEASTHDMKERLKIAETETARLTIENQRLMTKIVGMEENQAMMSRAELHHMIIQLEEAEQKASSKSTVLSGIRTNPAEVTRKKQTQEERQISWKLSNTEARLSQSEDENKRLREDLKDMLDTHSDLQVQLLAVSDLKDEDYYRENVESEHRAPDTPTTTTVPLNEDDVLFKLKKLEWDHCALKEEHASLEGEFELLQTRLGDVEKEKDELAKDRARFEESERLIEQLKREEEQQVELREKYVSLEKACQDIDNRIERLQNDNKQYKSTNENLTKQSRNQKNELEKIQNEIVKMKMENQRLTEENKKWSQQLQKRKDTVEETGNLVTETRNKEFNDLKRKYEESCKRLKELTSQTFKQTSQIKSLDITAPPPSPSILAEKFRNSLYEDKWAAAYSLLTKKFNKDDKKAIQILGELCTESYLFCKRAARVQMDTVLSSLTSPTANSYRSGGTFNKRNGHAKQLTDQLPEDLRRRLSSYRSRPSEQLVRKGVNDFLGQIDYDRTRHLRSISERELNEMMTYITTCFELCWGMAVQDPPIYLLFKVKHGQEVDLDRFDNYKTSGKRADFVVWPAVFTEENGSCLQKGVMLTLPERT